MLNIKLARRQAGKIVVYSVIIVVLIFVIWMLILQARGIAPQIQKQNTISSEFEQNIIDKAKKVYQQNKIQDLDFSLGPCLTNELERDWVLDIVHNPRKPIDDLAQNQCPAFILGQAHHFVELDLNGDFVRLK